MLAAQQREEGGTRCSLETGPVSLSFSGCLSGLLSGGNESYVDSTSRRESNLCRQKSGGGFWSIIQILIWNKRTFIEPPYLEFSNLPQLEDPGELRGRGT